MRTKTQIIRALSYKYKLPMATIESILKDVGQNAIYEAVNSTDHLGLIPNVGSIMLQHYRERVRINPSTGERIKKAAMIKLKFSYLTDVRKTLVEVGTSDSPFDETQVFLSKKRKKARTVAVAVESN